MSLTIPEHLGLYVHLPWCVKKCPYCDFNSHQLRSGPDELSYIDALLTDFKFEIDRLGTPRYISSIFIGGGTPSLFCADSINKLLNGIAQDCKIIADAEITLEANPGVVDESRFEGYWQAGVNRLSIGVQSFDSESLTVLGRIHDPEQAVSAAAMAKAAGFDNFNLDLMYCLPGQTVKLARADLKQAMALSPAHISAYHLTIEPNTLFAKQPPRLPNETVSWQIQQAYWSQLRDQGYDQYEISAYCKAGRECRHNLNYWRFGDYLGIGAGAHGKITQADGIYRSAKPKHPKQYLQHFNGNMSTKNNYLNKVNPSDLPLEYMMNKLRLHEGFTVEHFQSTTGLDGRCITDQIQRAIESGFLSYTNKTFTPTEKGKLFLNDLLQLFLPVDNGLKQCFG